MAEESHPPQSRESEPALTHFIETARAQGASDEFMAELLRSQGWSEPEIQAAFTRVYERLTDLPFPVPTSRSHSNARDAFLYLLSFATLGIWTQALGQIGFIAIDRFIPDPLSPTHGDRGYALASSLARLLVVFPLYLLLMRLLMGDLARHPEKSQSGVRKWLTYLALLIAALAAIIDLIVFLTSLLRGELTLRFTGKVSIVLAIASGILFYYLSWLQRQPARS